ncbi:UMP kinase [Patescibacteria group bacterium]|nr:MAG: UMP kinase [Patescibacteria group bacterium]
MPYREPIVVISLGGSLIAPPEGIDPAFLRKFRDLILGRVRQGMRFVLICGGGATARAYQRSARQVTELKRDDLDWIGIHATRLNGHLLRTIFRGFAHPRVLKDPTRPFLWREPIVVAAGWKPGASTDYDAVLMARKFKAGVVVNLSNIKTLFDRDPKKHPAARPICEIGWKEFRKMVGSKWDPGANLPFDPVASKLAEKIKLRVILADGRNLKNLLAILTGKKFVGSVIGT